MSKLDAYTDERLQTELAARKLRQEEAEKPKQLEQVDLTRLRQNCQEIIDDVGTSREYDTEYVFEAAMETIFGPDVFKWMNERT